MYIIITGCGRLGTELAVRFSNEGHDVVIIDKDQRKLASLGSGFNGASAAGIPFDEDVLQQAGIVNADVLAAVTDDDNVNVMISQIAKMIYGVPHVITRIADPKKVETFAKMGFDVVCPTMVAADVVERKLSQHEAEVHV